MELALHSLVRVCVNTQFGLPTLLQVSCLRHYGRGAALMNRERVPTLVEWGAEAMIQGEGETKVFSTR